MHKMRLLLAVLLAQFIPSAALCQNSLDGAKSAIAGIMAQIENNLIQKEAIRMNYTVWKANFDNYKPRLDELNGRFTELNAREHMRPRSIIAVWPIVKRPEHSWRR